GSLGAVGTSSSSRSTSMVTTIPEDRSELTKITTASTPASDTEGAASQGALLFVAGVLTAIALVAAWVLTRRAPVFADRGEPQENVRSIDAHRRRHVG
ncbi:MAG TPA: hypothetical protein VM165_15365, partial [Planctomycetaceae bacterium]|nr:hypothetical protein [Planctomycetaceae bacterium]